MKDLRTYIEELGVELKPIGKGIYRGWCPIHLDNKAGGKPQFTYWSSTDSFFCFRCSIGGDGIRLFAEVNHLSYSDAKKRLVGTEAEQLEELKETLDNLDVEIASSYNLQLNFSLRPKFRDLFYRFPDKTQDILLALKALDDGLKSKITFEKVGELFMQFKKFSESLDNFNKT